MEKEHIATVTDLTQYVRVIGDELYAGNVIVGSGPDYEGETYIYCEGHGDEVVYFDVSAEREYKGQGMVDLVRWLYVHKEC